MTTSEDKRCNISLEAYAKINLHAAKHSGLVLGFLVGSDGQQMGKGEAVITDILPICHSYPVGPIFEVAGQMCESYYPKDDVIGIYFASDQSYGESNKDFPKVLDSVCEVIKKNNANKTALIVRVVSDKIKPGSGLTTEAFPSGGKKSTPIEMKPLGNKDAAAYNRSLDTLLVSMRHLVLADVQDHMSSDASTPDGVLDPRNTHINLDLKA